MTALLTALLFVILISWCGVGPVCALLPRQDSARRVLLLPFVGLSVIFLLSLALSQFDFTGQTVAWISMGILSPLAVWSLYRSPLSRKEWRLGLAPILIGLAAMVFIGWPLFRSGLDAYWGYANTDQPFIAEVIAWMYQHPIGIPPHGFFLLEHYRHLPENTLLAAYYPIYIISTLTRIAPDKLFNVAEAGFLPLVPLGGFLFADVLRLPRRRAILASAAIAVCSLVAYTFYLDSLAALTTIAFCPATLALLLIFGEEGRTRHALLFAIVIAAMYYNYLGAIGVLGLPLAAIWLRLLVFRLLPVRRLIVASALSSVLIAATLAPYAVSILQMFIEESTSSRLSAKAIAPERAELANSFGLTLTEQGVPFFWGLAIPNVSRPHLPVLSVDLAAAFFFVAGCFCFAVLALTLWPSFSRLSGHFTWIVLAALLPIGFYAAKAVSYGVFKLVAWVCPIMITGLIAGLCRTSDWLRERNWRKLAWLPYLAIAFYVGMNVELSARLGSYTGPQPHAGSPQNAVNVPPQDVLALRDFSAMQLDGKVTVAVPDVISQLWLYYALFRYNPKLFPELQLYAVDSQTREHRDVLPEKYMLCWKDRKNDITEPFRGPAIWSTDTFALAESDQVSNLLIPGLGWYRMEGTPSAPVFWQRRLRWLRKRAEVFIWNPAQRPQSLMLTMTSGPGNPAPERHVSFYLNGRKFDEVAFTGSARIVTRPFEAVGQWSQLELEIREDASPLPRPHALWAKWVPKDPRRLNIAVSELALVDPSTATSVSYVNVDQEMRNPQTFVNGIYSDHWMGASAEIDLQKPGNARRVQLSGTLPQVRGIAIPYRIGLRANGNLVGYARVDHYGPFAVSVPWDEGIGRTENVRLELQPAATFAPTNGDYRRLSILLDSVGFTK